MAKIEVDGIYKIFGPKANSHLGSVKAGMSKEQLLEDTGHTLGLRSDPAAVNRH